MSLIFISLSFPSVWSSVVFWRRFWLQPHVFLFYLPPLLVARSTGKHISMLSPNCMAELSRSPPLRLLPPTSLSLFFPFPTLSNQTRLQMSCRVTEMLPCHCASLDFRLQILRALQTNQARPWVTNCSVCFWVCVFVFREEGEKLYKRRKLN